MPNTPSIKPTPAARAGPETRAAPAPRAATAAPAARATPATPATPVKPQLPQTPAGRPNVAPGANRTLASAQGSNQVPQTILFKPALSAAPQKTTTPVCPRMPKLHEFIEGVTIKNAKYAEFNEAVFRGIRQINLKIDAYNKAKTPNDKLALLDAICSMRHRMNNRYPLDFIARHRKYQEEIHQRLWLSLKEQYNFHNVKPLGNCSLRSRLAATASPSSVTEIFANMPHQTLQKFIELCWCYPQQFATEFVNLYPADDPNKKHFVDFLMSHEVTLLSQKGNTRNIKVEPRAPNPGPAVIVKVDARLGLPKSAEEEARLDNFTRFTALHGEERQASITYSNQIVDKDNPYLVRKEVKQMTATLVITDYCSGGDLRTNASLKHTQNRPLSEIVSSALDYYVQMADDFIELQERGIVFIDPKNSNWLIDKNNKLKISDTKSLLFTTASGTVDPRDDRNKWSDYIYTRHLVPPELIVSINTKNTNNPSIIPSAVHLHTYMLGKNLYEYLTNCKIETLFDYDPNTPIANPKHSFEEADFRHPVFSAPGGTELRALINKMVRPQHEQRIGLNEAFKELSKIKSMVSLINECIKLLDDLEKKVPAPSSKDPILSKFILDTRNSLQKESNPLITLQALQGKISALILAMDKANNLVQRDKTIFLGKGIDDRCKFFSDETVLNSINNTQSMKSKVQGINLAADDNQSAGLPARFLRR